MKETLSTKLWTTLYKMGVDGTTLVWKACCEGTTVRILHGQFGGSLQLDTVEMPTEGQAKQEYNRRIAIKMSKQGYIQKRPTSIPELPMLAKEYDPRKLPDLVYYQPKLDGIRCIAKKGSLTSRRNETITSCPHILEQLNSLPENMVLDGELYLHGRTFNDHLSLIKRDSPHEEHLEIIYYVFDLFNETMRYKDRLAHLSSHLPILPNVVLLHTESCHKDDIRSIIKKEYLDYEGIIIRDPNGLYKRNERSFGLQKLKRWQDGEFKIVDVEAATKGRERGAAKFVVEVVTKHENATRVHRVPVRPVGNLKERCVLYDNRDYIIGMWTRVTFLGYTEDGKLRDPRAEGLFEKKEDKP